MILLFLKLNDYESNIDLTHEDDDKNHFIPKMEEELLNNKVNINQY